MTPKSGFARSVPGGTVFLMVYRLLADGAVALHLAFIVFVVAGGFLVLRWPRLAWVHVPAFLWGATIEMVGFICPLTHLENHWRNLAAQGGYETSFVERYILPVVYPERLFGAAFPADGFFWIGVFVLALNGVIYARLWRRYGRGRKGNAPS